MDETLLCGEIPCLLHAFLSLDWSGTPVWRTGAISPPFARCSRQPFFLYWGRTPIWITGASPRSATSSGQMTRPMFIISLTLSQRDGVAEASFLPCLSNRKSSDTQKRVLMLYNLLLDLSSRSLTSYRRLLEFLAALSNRPPIDFRGNAGYCGGTHRSLPSLQPTLFGVRRGNAG